MLCIHLTRPLVFLYIVDLVSLSLRKIHRQNPPLPPLSFRSVMFLWMVSQTQSPAETLNSHAIHSTRALSSSLTHLFSSNRCDFFPNRWLELLPESAQTSDTADESDYYAYVMDAQKQVRVQLLCCVHLLARVEKVPPCLRPFFSLFFCLLSSAAYIHLLSFRTFFSFLSHPP